MNLTDVVSCSFSQLLSLMQTVLEKIGKTRMLSQLCQLLGAFPSVSYVCFQVRQLLKSINRSSRVQVCLLSLGQTIPAVVKCFCFSSLPVSEKLLLPKGPCQMVVAAAIAFKVGWHD